MKASRIAAVRSEDGGTNGVLAAVAASVGGHMTREMIAVNRITSCRLSEKAKSIEEMQWEAKGGGWSNEAVLPTTDLSSSAASLTKNINPSFIKLVNEMLSGLCDANSSAAAAGGAAGCQDDFWAAVKDVQKRVSRGFYDTVLKDEGIVGAALGRKVYCDGTPIGKLSSSRLEEMDSLLEKGVATQFKKDKQYGRARPATDVHLWKEYVRQPGGGGGDDDDGFPNPDNWPLVGSDMRPPSVTVDLTDIKFSQGAPTRTELLAARLFMLTLLKVCESGWDKKPSEEDDIDRMSSWVHSCLEVSKYIQLHFASTRDPVCGRMEFPPVRRYLEEVEKYCANVQVEYGNEFPYSGGWWPQDLPTGADEGRIKIWSQSLQ